MPVDEDAVSEVMAVTGAGREDAVSVFEIRSDFLRGGGARARRAPGHRHWRQLQSRAPTPLPLARVRRVRTKESQRYAVAHRLSAMVWYGAATGRHGHLTRHRS